MASARRIMIVDDHPVVREGLRGILRREEGLVVCGTAESIESALELAAEASPDLALVDISLPDGSGLDLVTELLRVRSGILVLVSSIHDEALFAERALAAGASGYVSKHEEADTLVGAVRTVLDGDIYLSPKMHQRLLRRAAGRDVRRRRGVPLGSLTARELEVFTLLGEAAAVQEIARRLGISVKTVQAHRENIKQKLELANASELLRAAFEYQFERQAGTRNSRR